MTRQSSQKLNILVCPNEAFLRQKGERLIMLANRCTDTDMTCCGEITICGMTGASWCGRWGETERLLAPTLNCSSSDFLFSSMIRPAMTTIKREKRDGHDALRRMRKANTRYKACWGRPCPFFPSSFPLTFYTEQWPRKIISLWIAPMTRCLSLA